MRKDYNQFIKTNEQRKDELEKDKIIAEENLKNIKGKESNIPAQLQAMNAELNRLDRVKNNKNKNNINNNRPTGNIKKPF